MVVESKKALVPGAASWEAHANRKTGEFCFALGGAVQRLLDGAHATNLQYAIDAPTTTPRMDATAASFVAKVAMSFASWFDRSL
jgi:hypothetical protein